MRDPAINAIATTAHLVALVVVGVGVIGVDEEQRLAGQALGRLSFALKQLCRRFSRLDHCQLDKRLILFLRHTFITI